MQVNVTFRHMDATDALKSFAAEKVQRIEKYISTPADADVVLSVEKYMHKADITIKAHGMMMRGKEKSEDMYASIDRAMQKIEKQVRRYRDKISNHKPRGGSTAKITMNVLAAERASSEMESQADQPAVEHDQVVETKEIHAQMMTVSEAQMQMDLLHNEFFVFLNADSGSMCVLFRRKDGNLGLIDAPHPEK